MIDHENSTHQTIVKQFDPDVEKWRTKLDNVFIAISLSDIYLNNFVHEGALEFSGSMELYHFDDKSDSVVFS